MGTASSLRAFGRSIIIRRSPVQVWVPLPFIINETEARSGPESEGRGANLSPDAFSRRLRRESEPAFCGERQDFICSEVRRSWEHVTQCYLMGTPAQIRARIEELAAAGLEYIVLSPLDYDLAQLDLWQAEIVRHFPD